MLNLNRVLPQLVCNFLVGLDSVSISSLTVRVGSLYLSYEFCNNFAGMLVGFYLISVPQSIIKHLRRFKTYAC